MDTPPSDEDLVAQAQPLSDGPKLTRDIGDMQLPPAELLAELDNQTPGNVEAPPELEVATLDFFGDELPTWKHPLKYPFRWEGVSHKEIVVTQLTTAQVGEIYRKARAAGRMPDLMDVYAEMTGLPAKVLRALPAVDGDPVTEKCWDFLPPSLRPESDLTSAETTS
jgi:hypothetical protein